MIQHRTSRSMTYLFLLCATAAMAAGARAQTAPPPSQPPASPQPATPPPAPTAAKTYQQQVEERLRSDWAYLARYRDENARVGPPAPDENRVVFKIGRAHV